MAGNPIQVFRFVSSLDYADKYPLGPFNYETNMVPVVGMVVAPESNDMHEQKQTYLNQYHSERLLEFIASDLDVHRDCLSYMSYSFPNSDPLS